MAYRSDMVPGVELITASSPRSRARRTSARRDADGWIDASGAAAAAMAALEHECNTSALVEFDDDLYIDYRARRPILELRDGVNDRLIWSSPVAAARPRSSGDVLTLSGPEPDMAWHRFASTVAELADQLGVVHMAALGAYPFATPHTRPSHVSATSPPRDVLAALPFRTSSVDVPAGMAAALELTCTSAASLPWGSGPSAALRRVHVVPGGLGCAARGADHGDRRPHRGNGAAQESLLQRERLDQLVEGNDEHQAMIAQFERLYDAADDVPTTPAGGLELRSAEELADEVERFLREQGKSESRSRHPKGDREQDRGDERGDRAKVVGARPLPDVALPVGDRSRVVGVQLVERVVAGDGWYTAVSTTVTRYTAAPITVYTAYESPQSAMATTAAATDVPAVPNNASMNSGFGAYTLIDCIAVIPIGAGSLASDRMTNVEKAKNTPATSPLPMALMNTNTALTPSTITPPPRHPTRRRRRPPGVPKEVPGLTTERPLHAVGEVRTAAVEHLGEQLDQSRHMAPSVACGASAYALPASGGAVGRVTRTSTAPDGGVQISALPLRSF